MKNTESGSGLIDFGSTCTSNGGLLLLPEARVVTQDEMENKQTIEELLSKTKLQIDEFLLEEKENLKKVN